MLISSGNSAPDDRWPWRHAGSLWVLSCPIAGPIGEVVNESIYASTFAWTPGWSAMVRGQVMGVAALLALITIALLLWPNRATFAMAIGLSIFATVGILAWRHALGSVDRVGGDIIAAGDGLNQHDAYVYERAKQDSTQTVPWVGWTHPLFASEVGLSQAAMQLNLTNTGELAFSYRAQAGCTTAFLRRAVIMGPHPIMTAVSSRSPMQEVAKAEYRGCQQPNRRGDAAAEWAVGGVGG